VASNTPVRTGKARDSVRAFFDRGDDITMAGRVMYDYRETEAFYMRFVLGGSVPHMIRPKFSTDRGMRQATRRAERRGLSTEITAKKALRLGDGRFASEVQHPGTGAARILTRRLSAMEMEILEMINSRIGKMQALRDFAERPS
jgi:hypothetical protein